HAVFDAVVLLVLTFGGVLQFFAGVSAGWFSNALLQGTALIALYVVVTSLIDLPFSYHRTFNIEARFGFNKMTRGMWLGDLVKHAAVACALGLPLVLAVLWLIHAAGTYVRGEGW